MSNGDNTANVGDLVEVESHIHLILKVKGEINQLGLRRCEISREMRMLSRDLE